MRDSLLPIMVSVIGWIVVFEQAASLKNRDDVHKLITDSKNTVDGIFQSSITYFCENDHHIGFLSSEIRAEFLLLSHYIFLLRQKGLKSKLEPYVVDYRKSVMGKHFETLDFKKQLVDQENISKIANSRSELKFRLDKMHSDWARNRSFINRFLNFSRERCQGICKYLSLCKFPKI